MTDEELGKEVRKIIKENPSINRTGPLIGLCIKTLAGRADNRRIAQMVSKKFKRGII